MRLTTCLISGYSALKFLQPWSSSLTICESEVPLRHGRFLPQNRPLPDSESNSYTREMEAALIQKSGGAGNHILISRQDPFQTGRYQPCNFSIILSLKVLHICPFCSGKAHRHRNIGEREDREHQNGEENGSAIGQNILPSMPTSVISGM